MGGRMDMRKIKNPVTGRSYKFMSKKAPIFREEMNCDKYFNKNGISYLIDGNK
jgi:hypothetical protein